MRTYTLAFSSVVHMVVVAILVVTPIVANGVLPEPRRAFDFITVRPVEPPPPPPAPRTPHANRRATRHASAAPTVAPDSITPETGIEPVDSLGIEGDPGVTDGVVGGADLHLLAAEPAPPPPPPVQRKIVRVGGSILPPQKIKHVAPAYPALARAARRDGVVILEAVIGDDGKVRSLRVLRSIDLLDQAAVDAVRQWQFTPTLLNGEPVPVVMTVTVSFVLES
jgi:periplasmic protein TonB